MEDLDALVTDTMLQTVQEPDVYARLRKAGERSDREVMEARAEVARLTGKLDDARARWAADRLSLDDYEDMAGRLKPLIRAAQERAETAGVHPALRTLLAPGEDVAERWKAMPLATRRDAVRALMSVRVERSRTVGGRRVETWERVAITPA